MAGAVEIVDVVVVVVADTAGVAVEKTAVAVVVAVDSKFSGCPGIASYCLAGPPGQSRALS